MVFLVYLLLDVAKNGASAWETLAPGGPLGSSRLGDAIIIKLFTLNYDGANINNF